MSNPFPQPSKLFATISALVIAVNLFLLSCITAGILQSNPFAILGGLLVLPLCVLMAIQQYRGTFRRVPSAARTTSVLLYLAGGFMIFSLIVSTGEAILAGTSLRLMGWILIPMSIVATYSIVAGRMNALWAHSIRSIGESCAANPVRRGFSLRELFLVVSIVAVMTATITQWIRSESPRCAENIDLSTAPLSLPPGATDISYCKGHRDTIAYEYTIDEPAFREWVDSGIGSIESMSAEVPLREITSPFRITRYYAYASELKGSYDIVINSGLYYVWSQEDRGVYAAYDRTAGRAYYHVH